MKTMFVPMILEIALFFSNMGIFCLCKKYALNNKTNIVLKRLT